MAYFFVYRPKIRAIMQSIEESYRLDERVPDDEALTKEDVFMLRKHVMDQVRRDLINALGPSRYIH